MKTPEQVSCLVDGELSTEDHLTVGQAVLEDATMHASWARYQQIRQVLQHDTAPDAAGVAARVQQALAAEPTVFAPAAAGRSRAPRRRWQMALAASVALLAIGLAPHWMAADSPPDQVPVAQVSAPESTPPAYLSRYLAEHHAYLGASHVTQPNSGVMAVRYVQ